VAVRIRMKKMGKKGRPCYRIVVVDARCPRDGKVIEEVGTYDPFISNVDARVTVKRERIDYWLSVGAQASEKTGVLLKKYGTNGTHLAQHESALTALKAHRNRYQAKSRPATISE
jgi:small subunit ribosomal protein S16